MPEPWTGMWITITGHAIGNDRDGFRIAYDWDRRQFSHKSEAVSNGFEATGTDDFNVGFIENGRLESLWWMEKNLGEDESTLAEIGREIGLVTP
jgi:hypothetical protein